MAGRILLHRGHVMAPQPPDERAPLAKKQQEGPAS